MAKSSEPLLAPTFLFRFSVPCLYRRSIWTGSGARLEPRFQLPSFGELENRPLFAEVRAAWNRQGLSFWVRVQKKKKTVWCRETRVEESDGLNIWINTRDTKNIHRATRYCHRFVFLPFGGGRKASLPVARWVPVGRAQEISTAVAPTKLKVLSEARSDGYLLESHIPAEALTGFDVDEHPNLGFTYAVVDRELGWQTFGIGPEFPFQDDPSLWGTLELAKA